MNYQGKRIAFTGIARNYERPEIHAAITSIGAKLDNSVTRRTALLVIGENPGNGTGKRDAAQQHGVPTMSAQAFMDAVRNGSGLPISAAPAVARKGKKAAVPKEVTQAITDLGKQNAMTGFVGF
jgi:BRCT domain type II-containing protein